MRLKELERENDLISQLTGRVCDIAARGLVSPDIDLRKYIRESWPIIEPAKQYVHNWHIDYISEHLEAVDLGQITRLNISIEPRVMKSILCSVNFPTWTWTRKPWVGFMFISYNQNLSNDLSKKRRDLIMSSWYQTKWGSLVYLAPDQNQKAEFQNTAKGNMIATSVGGTATGKGADIIVVDDGMNPERAESEADRETANRFVKNTVFTRLNDKKNGVIINVAQRLHKKDVSAVLMEEGNWVNLEIPAIAPRKTIISFPITKRVIERQEGELLWPERESIEVLDRQKRAMGARAFNAQYQQDPSADEASYFRRGNWKYYKLPAVEMAKSLELSAQSWDMSFKETRDGSYVCGLLGGYRGPDIYLLDLVRARMNFTSTKMAVKSFTTKWPLVAAKLIEDKANGPAIMDELKKDVSGIIAIQVDGSKEARAAAVSPYQEAGNVFLPEGAAWVSEFVEELADFPGGTNDDQVDVFSQLVSWLISRRRNSNRFITVA